jgi:peptidyl-Lys metalloendopeptidase
MMTSSFRYVLLACAALVFSNPVHARMAGCTKAQEATIKTAIGDAKRLAVTAAAAVGDTIEYTRWFGKYSPSHAERVRSNLKNLARAVRTGAVTAQCDPVGFDACESSTFAFVYPDEPYLIHLCPNFFRQPTMAQLRPGTNRSDNGTRSGTIIHELSHFTIVARTEDECYSRTDCGSMAERDARRAVQNADSYQYYVEDITHFAEERAQRAADETEQED